MAYRRGGGDRWPAEALRLPHVSSALQRWGVEASARGLEPRVAALLELPDDDAGRERAVLAYRSAAERLSAIGVGLDLWPQLPFDGERFLNTYTVDAFARRLLPLLDDLDGVRFGVALDFEPPTGILDAAWILGQPRERPRAVPGAVWGAARDVRRSFRAGRRGGRRSLRDLVDAIESRGRSVHVAQIPPLTGSVELGARLRDRLLGCPMVCDDNRLLGRPAPMAYATLARRALGGPDREREQQLLRGWARRHEAYVRRRDLSGALAIALGQLGRGIVGEEPVYDDAEHLADDVALVRELGYEDVSLFCLEGALFGPAGVPQDDAFRPTREDHEDWLRASLGR